MGKRKIVSQLMYELIMNTYGRWDTLMQDCWYTNTNLGQRMAWQVSYDQNESLITIVEGSFQMATQMAWTALTAIGEVVCSVTVMVFMLRHRVCRTVSSYSVALLSDMSSDSSSSPLPFIALSLCDSVKPFPGYSCEQLPPYHRTHRYRPTHHIGSRETLTRYPNNQRCIRSFPAWSIS